MVKMTFLLLRPVFPLNVFFSNPHFLQIESEKVQVFLLAFPIVCFFLFGELQKTGRCSAGAQSLLTLLTQVRRLSGGDQNTNPGLALDNDRGPIYERKYH